MDLKQRGPEIRQVAAALLSQYRFVPFMGYVDAGTSPFPMLTLDLPESAHERRELLTALAHIGFDCKQERGGWALGSECELYFMNRQGTEFNYKGEFTSTGDGSLALKKALDFAGAEANAESQGKKAKVPSVRRIGFLNGGIDRLIDAGVDSPVINALRDIREKQRAKEKSEKQKPPGSHVERMLAAGQTISGPGLDGR